MTPLYAGIGGVVRELTEMDAGINGVVTPLTEMWAGVGGVSRRIFSAGPKAGDLQVGDVIQLNVNGISTNFLVVHQGLPSDIYDSSCDGTWLLMEDIYTNRIWNGTGLNTYASSSINTYLNNAFFNLLDDKIRTSIKQIKLPYIPGGGNYTVNSGSKGLRTKCFLLSYAELGIYYSYLGKDGSKLDYFILDEANAGGTEAEAKRIAYYNQIASIWNTRTARDTSSNQMYYRIDDDGSVRNTISSNYYKASGVRPCFILPQDFVL